MEQADFGGREASALVAPGLEDLLVAELARLGVDARKEVGGALFRADWARIHTVHERTRLANRVVLRLGRVGAGSLEELYQGVRLLPWKPFVHPRQAVEVEVTTLRAKLRRKEAVSDKVGLAIVDALRGPRMEGPKPPKTPLIVRVHVEDSRAAISVDLSGEPLHRRGWRPMTAKAPMREALAAAVLDAAGWVPGVPLVDPMCGAGTFAIEAARFAAGMTPRLSRTYAADTMPGAPKARAASAAAAAVPTAVSASDRDVGAIRATTENARRAGVEPRIRIRHLAFEDLEPPAPAGLLVCNPPWGHRIGGDRTPWKRWADRLGDVWGGWRIAFVVPAELSAARLGWEGETRLRFESGGVPLRLEVGEIPA